MERAHRTSRATAARVKHGSRTVRSRKARLALLLSIWLATVAWTTPAAQAVFFSGPTFHGVGTAPQLVAIANFNGESDSDPDLAVVNEFSDDVSILLGAAGSSFNAPTNLTAGSAPLAVAVGDFNADSDPDLAVANEGSSNVSILLGGPAATFSAPTNYPAGNVQGLAVGEFNGDFDPDLAMANGSSNSISILLGSTDGAFVGPTSKSVPGKPMSIAVGEFNGDGHQDLVTANELANRVSILLGSGGGSFTGAIHFPVGAGPRAVAVGHFDGDADQDLAVTNELDGNVSIMLGSTGGSFTEPTNFGVGALPGSLVVGEFSNDSDPDIAVANQESGNVSLLYGSAGGGFIGPDSFGAGNGPTSVARGDFNGDSRSDLAVTNELSDDVSILLGTDLNGHPRPKSAAQIRVPLVIAYEGCTLPNSSHSGGLAGGSCTPAVQRSTQLTVGTRDANGLSPNGAGFLKLTVCTTGTTSGEVCSTPAGMAAPDVRIEASFTDVRCRAGASPCEGGELSDYLGELRVNPAFRVTDRHNAVTAGATGEPGTAGALPFPFTLPCTANAGGSGPQAIGATCSVVTSGDAVSPGSIVSAKRGNWELDAIEVTDGGPDGDVDTTGNAVFARQGIFVP
jgi:predicted NUDIX family NTP pyrophosphohydrolase